jgi:hypothetical protein
MDGISQEQTNSIEGIGKRKNWTDFQDKKGADDADSIWSKSAGHRRFLMDRPNILW